MSHPYIQITKTRIAVLKPKYKKHHKGWMKHVPALNVYKYNFTVGSAPQGVFISSVLHQCMIEQI